MTPPEGRFFHFRSACLYLHFISLVLLFSQSMLPVGLTFLIFVGAMESSITSRVLLKVLSKLSVHLFGFWLLSGAVVKVL